MYEHLFINFPKQKNNVIFSNINSYSDLYNSIWPYLLHLKFKIVYNNK